MIYVKRMERTPETTTITLQFPDGQEINYESSNVILENFTKEYIVEKRLFQNIMMYGKPCFTGLFDGIKTTAVKVPDDFDYEFSKAWKKVVMLLLL